MATPVLRIGIVGASSLLGKELSEELGRSSLAAADVKLLDDADAEGQLQTAGDELTLVQKLDEGAFRGLDLVFFTGTPGQTLEHWQAARESGATVIDLTRCLSGVAGASTWVPGLAPEPDLQTTVVVPAYGAALMLALVGERLRAAGLEARLFAATVLLPASEFGRAALDELHQQTVSLLSFQAVPEEVFGTQVAFNVVAQFGTGATVNFETERETILRQYAGLGGGQLPELLLQTVQVPVFHGCTISLMMELERPADVAALEQALRGPQIQVSSAGDGAVTDETEPAPSNLAAVGQADVLVRVAGEARRFSLWMAADTLRMATAAAMECAQHMRRLRPRGAVQ